MNKNIVCSIAFGSSSGEAYDSLQEDDKIDGINYVDICNPMPTGDHQKVIKYALLYKKRGTSALSKIPSLKRDFAKNAAGIFAKNEGIVMEISSSVAREFRDTNGLRNERGRVFVFIKEI